MKKIVVQCFAALKPLNVFAPLARRRVAGSHKPYKRPEEGQRKDLVQRLREAGL